MNNGATSTSPRSWGVRRLTFGLLLVALPAIAAEPALASATTIPTASATVTPAVTATSTIVAVSSASTTAPVTMAVALTTPAAAATPTARTVDVPLYYQAYTLSCEESALRMALASQGINVTDAQVLSVIGTDTRSAYFDAGGLRWGDPYATFVGDPTGSQTALSGYGTYYPTIAAAATALGGQVLAAGEGITPATLYADVLAGHPAVVWVTYQWAAASRQDYVAFDGRTIPYAGPVEHAVTLVGVTANDVVINNPDFGREVISKSLFEARYATYNDMAVVLN
jgi:uncharacterized protein YvpB